MRECLEQRCECSTRSRALEARQLVQRALKVLAPCSEGRVVAAEGALHGVLRREEQLARAIDNVGHVEATARIRVDGGGHGEGGAARLRARVEHVRVIETLRELARVVANVRE